MGAIKDCSGRVGDVLLFPSHKVMLSMSPLKKVEMTSGGAQFGIFSMLRKYSCCWVFMTRDDMFQESSPLNVHPVEIYLFETYK